MKYLPKIDGEEKLNSSLICGMTKFVELSIVFASNITKKIKSSSIESNSAIANCEHQLNEEILFFIPCFLTNHSNESK